MAAHVPSSFLIVFHEIYHAGCGVRAISRRKHTGQFGVFFFAEPHIPVLPAVIASMIEVDREPDGGKDCLDIGSR